ATSTTASSATSPAASTGCSSDQRRLDDHRSLKPNASSALCSPTGLTAPSTAHVPDAPQPRRLALALQPSTQPLSPRPPSSGQQNQPGWVLQLAAPAGGGMRLASGTACAPVRVARRYGCDSRRQTSLR